MHSAYCCGHYLFLLQFFFKVSDACIYAKECSLPSFVGNFVCKVSHEADYEMIEFLVVGIEVLLALE